MKNTRNLLQLGLIFLSLMNMQTYAESARSEVSKSDATKRSEARQKSLFLMIRESDLSKTKMVRELQEKFGAFFRQLEEADLNFRKKLEQEAQRLSKGSEKLDAAKMKILGEKFEAHKTKVEKIRDEVNKRMQDAINGVNEIVARKLQVISKNHDGKAVLIAEKCFAYIPDESTSTTVSDVTDELVAEVNKCPVPQVQLPIIQL